MKNNKILAGNLFRDNDDRKFKIKGKITLVNRGKIYACKIDTSCTMIEWPLGLEG